MPIKYRPDVVTKDRSSNKVSIKRHYVKDLTTEELWENYLKERTPKIKNKFRNEIYSRGFNREDFLLRDQNS